MTHSAFKAPWRLISVSLQGVSTRLTRGVPYRTRGVDAMVDARRSGHRRAFYTPQGSLPFSYTQILSLPVHASRVTSQSAA